MTSIEILWRTPRGDTAGVRVHGTDAEHPQHMRLFIGTGFCLRIPPTEARLLAQALIDAADTAPALTPARRAIPIHAAAPAALYHDPDQF